MPRPVDEDASHTHSLLRDNGPPAAPGVRVTVLAGPDAGQVIAVEGPAASVGRARGNDVRLSDPLVSSFHVELSATEGGLRVHDLNSRNGTYHGGVRLERAVVPSGARLEVGGTLLGVETHALFEQPVVEAQTFGELRASSGVMRALFYTLGKLSRADLAVLIEGPTGTGKELVARALHANSGAASGPFIVLDCAAVPAGLAESVLFGHERGAFTGASETRAGVFETASGGTLFLDEIGELPVDLQPKLLRALERREIVRVGSSVVRPVRVRVVSATWRDLRVLINKGRFREDLYYRLAQARVTVPALAEREDDVPLLVSHFLSQRPADAPGARAIAPDALTQLCSVEYPGNVRELKSVVERAAALAEGPVITMADLACERMLSGEGRRTRPADADASPPPARPLERFKEAKRSVVDEFERGYLQRLLVRAGDNITRAAQLAGVERNTIRDLLRRHGFRDIEG